MGIIMGGGLGFLNKKPWHPGSLRNMEKIAKREKEIDLKKKKLTEHRKHILKEYEESSKYDGPKKRSEFQSWFYESSSNWKTFSESREVNANDLSLKSSLTDYNKNRFDYSSSLKRHES